MLDLSNRYKILFRVIRVSEGAVSSRSLRHHSREEKRGCANSWNEHVHVAFLFIFLHSSSMVFSYLGKRRRSGTFEVSDDLWDQSTGTGSRLRQLVLVSSTRSVFMP